MGETIQDRSIIKFPKCCGACPYYEGTAMYRCDLDFGVNYKGMNMHHTIEERDVCMFPGRYQWARIFGITPTKEKN